MQTDQTAEDSSTSTCIGTNIGTSTSSTSTNTGTSTSTSSTSTSSTSTSTSTSSTSTNTGTGTSTSSEESADSRGIPGWNHVDKLARGLVELRGLCVTGSEAEKIKELYHNLLEFDKRPLASQPRPLSTPRGRFGRRKQPSHFGEEHMKR